MSGGLASLSHVVVSESAFGLVARWNAMDPGALGQGFGVFHFLQLLFSC